MAASTRNRSFSGSRTRRNTPPVAAFVITSSGNMVRDLQGRTITWRYFLSTLPKSLLYRTDGRNVVSFRTLQSRLRERRILLITQPRKPETSLDLSKELSRSLEVQAEIRRLVRKWSKHSSRTTSNPRPTPLFRSKETSQDLSEPLVRSILSEAGLSRKSERALESRSSIGTGSSPTPTTCNTMKKRKQNGTQRKHQQSR